MNLVAFGVLGLFGVGAAFSCAAADISLSGFGTLGYARSDQAFAYQRFIDDRGTLKRDSVAGVQADTRFGGNFGATIQVKAAAASKNDTQFEGTVSWAFLTYRPTNDWLFRLGKQRIPFYLYSQTFDVGVTYDFARLPTEMYSIAPSNDAVGLSFSKNWALEAGEVTVDGYWGRSKNDFRFWSRDGIPGLVPQGASFNSLDFRGGGLVLALKSRDDTFRMSLHRAVIRAHNRQPFPSEFPFVAVAPGIGYYQVDPAIPGPGIGMVSEVTSTLLTLGLDVSPFANLRVIGEFARVIASEANFAPQGNRGYIALIRRTGNWSPYATYGFLRSPSGQLDFYRRVNENRLPSAFPGADLINASQRAGADQIIVTDQHSWAVGTSYSFSPTAKLKAEYMRTEIGAVSYLVDTPPGGNVRNKGINVFSVSYSVVF
jgi:hypothetical protein